MSAIGKGLLFCSVPKLNLFTHWQSQNHTNMFVLNTVDAMIQFDNNNRYNRHCTFSE